MTTPRLQLVVEVALTAPDPAQRPALPDGLVFADTPSRLAAYVIDSFLLGIVASIPPAFLGLYDTTYTGGVYPEPISREAFVGLTIFTFAVTAAYFLWFWTSGWRGTPGQRVFSIQLGNAFDGRPLTMNQAAVRWLAMGWWLSLPVLLPSLVLAGVSYGLFIVWWIVLVASMIVSPTKQGIHDRLARSALVRPAGRGNRWAVGCLLALAVITVLEVLLLAFLFSTIGAMEEQGIFPPGTDPTEYILDQVRVIWPS